MGMDVVGCAAEGRTGHFFYNSNLRWSALWAYCCVGAPDLISREVADKCKSNDGGGLSAEAARELGARLQREILSGRTAEFAESLRVSPNARLRDCGFSVENARRFAEFLLDCGGFAVW